MINIIKNFQKRITELEKENQMLKIATKLFEYKLNSTVYAVYDNEIKECMLTDVIYFNKPPYLRFKFYEKNDRYKRSLTQCADYVFKTKEKAERFREIRGIRK